MRLRAIAGGRSFEIEIDHEQFVWLDGEPLYVQLEQVGGLPVYSLVAGEEGYLLFIDEGQDAYQVEIQGRSYSVRVEEDRPQLPAGADRIASQEVQQIAIQAPLAGQLVRLLVTEGEQVASGQAVAIVESMKMQMPVRTPLAGEVIRIRGPVGRDVDRGEDLATVLPA